MLGHQQILKLPTQRVARAQPDKVEQLMDEDPGEFGSRAIEPDAPLAQEGPGMHRTMTVTKAFRRLDAHGQTGERRQTPQKRISQTRMPAFLKNENLGSRHPLRVPRSPSPPETDLSFDLQVNRP